MSDWTVCFSSFFIIFLCDSIAMCYGILLVNLLETFDDDKTKLSLVGSAFLGFTLLVGPAVSWLLDRFGCRHVIIGATLGAFLGFVVSAFSVNPEMLIVTYGIIAGGSCGIVYITGITMVGLHFTRHRSMATGIAMSGGGAGVLVMGYPIERLTFEYGWRGTVLILAAIFLNCCVFGALISPSGFKPFKKLTNYCKKRKRENDVDNCNQIGDQIIANGAQFKNSSKHLHAKETECSSARDKQTNVERYSSLPTIYSNSDQERTSVNTTTMDGSSEHNLDISQHVKYIDVLHRPEYFDIKAWSSVPLINKCEKNNYNKNENIQIRDLNVDQGDYKERKKPMSMRQSYTFLAKSLSFILVLVVMCSSAGNISVIIYLPDLAISKGVNHVQAALLISMFGVTNIVGRVVSGALCSHTRFDSLHLYIFVLFVSGIGTALLPHCTTFAQFSIGTLVFGLCWATLLTLRTIVLVDVLGIELLTVSFGIVCFTQGICETIGPPISGVLFKTSESFEVPFYLIAALQGVAAILCCALKCLERRKPKPLG